MCVCCRVGQEDVDVRLSGQFIKELHCVFCSEVEDNGEGKTDHYSALECVLICNVRTK